MKQNILHKICTSPFFLRRLQASYNQNRGYWEKVQSLRKASFKVFDSKSALDQILVK